ITLKSICNFSTIGKIPNPDLLVLDEFSKMLEQLHSNIYQKNEASKVYTVLKHMISNAKQVLIMDADITDVEVNWLRNIRADVYVVMNTFDRNSGSLFVHPTRDSLRDKFISILNNKERKNRPTVFCANTASEIQTLEVYLKDKTSYQILSIHSQNSSNREQQEFLKNPDKNIAKYDAVLISPSAMTGIDIQTKVYAKFGNFAYSPHHTPSATGCAQLLERSRNSNITHIWIEQANGKSEEDPEVIYEEYRLAALRSDAFLMGLEIDKAGILNLSGVTKEIHEIQSQLIARDNISRNNLYENLLNLLARNYKIQPYEGTTGIHKQAIIEAAKARKDQWDHLVCTVKPVDDEMLEKMIRSNTAIDIHFAGNTRFHIETFYDMKITHRLYQFDKDGKGRYRVTNFVQAILMDPEVLCNFDWEESNNETPLTAREFRTMKAKTINAFIEAVWGNRNQFLENPVMSKRDIAEKTNRFLEDHKEDVRLYFKYRHDHSQDPWNVAKRLLRRFGLNFKQIRSRDEFAVKHYKIDPSNFSYVQKLAKQHLDNVTKKRISMFTI
ncbi:MAG: hypothetical protein AAFR81_12885, partial [Chloroflexota bacterium]